MILGHDTITLLKRSNGAADRLGVPTQTVTPIVKTGVSVQAMSDTETNSNVDISISMWKVYCPVDADYLSLTATDAISYRGVVYEDFGDPQLWTGANGKNHHVTIILRKARG